MLVFGVNRATPGWYVDPNLNVHGCDSVVELTVAVAPVFTIQVALTICSNDSVFVGGGWQNTAGVYHDTLSSSQGCDSMVATTLTVYLSAAIQASAAICAGDSILLAGSYQHSSGTYIDSLTTANGCDSVVTTVLVVYPGYAEADTLYLCNGDSVLLDGSWQSTAGSCVNTLQTGNGCDSVVTTVLLLHPTYNVQHSVALCDGDSTFAGGAYQTTSGVYVDSLSTANGCDSTVITTVTVHPNTVTPAMLTICDGESVVLGGGPQTTSGTYVDTLSSANGCDSIVETLLTVLPVATDSVASSICEGDSIFLQNMWQSLPGTYTDSLIGALGCDSVVVTTLTVVDGPSAGTNGSDTLCMTDPPTPLLPMLGGAPDGNGTWTDDSNCGCLLNGAVIPGDASPGVYLFTYSVPAPAP